MNTERSKSEASKWCLGAPCTGSRPISSAEISYFKSRLRIIRAKGIGLVIGTFALLPFVFLLLYLTRKMFFASFPQTGFIDTLFGVIPFFAILLGIPVLLSLAGDHLKKAGSLKKDMGEGFAYRFEGHPEEREELLRKLKLPAGKEGEKQVFEALPRSGLIFSVNGNLLETPYGVEITEAAPAPENPFVISLPKDILEADFTRDMELSRRRLIPEEIDELKLHKEKFREIHWPSFLFMIFMSFLAFLGGATSESLAGWFKEFKFPISVWLFFLIISSYRYLRNFIYSRRFSEDLKLGWVIIFKGEEAAKEAEEQTEILPVSFAPWTEKGRPSNWRMLKANR